MEATNRKRDKATITIREMEVDGISDVYHPGEELFTGDELPFLYRIWDPYRLTNCPS
ncbi:MAG: hypothetical protein ISS55_00690 [Dehalococcoidales bacterium]|nr:hypothetical protein [Dehalococcoidales bacterium]